ncbi:hypothetical protein AVT69_gp050 [Pseudomonas phage PhiPA3]|uniref:Uncharacterized protein 049 n=1 Tax=Pseudomonas phage PhiPA3 TaxID=998086 RepID=F8SJT1_BPPA3|nr:hypothetical protein AVT69_gp050 [Pseudomonas phage PhiPA3]AEH03476.1 hypothetical protein [Pseudomonas phage PhiPA3]
MIEQRSAYEEAVLHGFKGSQDDWFRSLEGRKHPYDTLDTVVNASQAHFDYIASKIAPGMSSLFIEQKFDLALDEKNYLDKVVELYNDECSDLDNADRARLFNMVKAARYLIKGIIYGRPYSQPRLLEAWAQCPKSRFDYFKDKVPRYDTECTQVHPDIDLTWRLNKGKDMQASQNTLRGQTSSITHMDDAMFMSTHKIPELLTPVEEISTADVPPANQSIPQGNRKERRIAGKKQKNKRKKHIANCKSGFHKAVMGSMVLSRLGRVQQDTQDNLKKALLKDHAMADVVEAATGEKLPAYQRNLLNQMQERAQHGKSIVEEHERLVSEEDAEMFVNKGVPEEVLDGQFNLVPAGDSSAEESDEGLEVDDGVADRD